MAEKSLINNNLESQLWNSSRQYVYSLGETSNCSQGLLLTIPGLISSSVCMHKCSSGFTLVFYNAVYLVSQRISLAGWLVKPPGSKELQNLLPFLSKMVPDLLLLRAGTEFGQCPGRSEAVRPALLLLNPEDFLHLNFPKRNSLQLWCAGYRIGRLN